MMQSKKHSFIEASTNCFIGWLVAFLSQLVIFPIVDIHVDLYTNLEISVYFTLVSLLRSYCLRRIFNRL
jgi:hypothetical protein